MPSVVHHIQSAAVLALFATTAPAQVAPLPLYAIAVADEVALIWPSA